MNEYPGLGFFENENRLFARFIPSAERPLLNGNALLALLDQAGYGKWAFADEPLAKLVESYNAATVEFELQIGERRDASFSLDISSDAMQAWACFIPACGGEFLEPEAIYLALGEAGVTHGVDQAAVSAACAANAEGRVLIASGTPAENGEDSRFELLVADARDRAPQVAGNGLVDFRELGAIPTVVAEQALMRRIPPTTGTAGRNVRGEVIEPVAGKNEFFAEKLVGAYVDRDDANLLRAEFSGQPVCCGNAVNIEHVLHVRNVNMASGNIVFDGTVNVEGEVLSGMKVHATGDIVVGGVVDGAELDAGGDIRIGGGIIAKALVRAGGAVAARFVENARVLAGTTIAIDDTALQADLQANNQILVGIKSPLRGRLAGGSARAMMLIRAPILGSSTGGVTRLLLGVNPVLEAQYQELVHRIEKQREEENNLEKLVNHLNRLGDKAGAGMLERAKNSWQLALQAWAKLLPERDELERQLALMAGARIEVGGSVDGAIDLAFGKKVMRLRRSYGAGSLSMAGDQVVFTDGAGNEIPAG